VGFLAAAVVVAWSRLALGCHHFSDVMASIFWGLAVGPWMSRCLAKIVNSRLRKPSAARLAF
jgi:membrane-associated phospholipid phosphatase